jgi:hypothetical protein
MPFGDKTGPREQGPMMGRGLCAGFQVPGSTNTLASYGMGRRHRGGHGGKVCFRALSFRAGREIANCTSTPVDRKLEVAALRDSVGGLLTALRETQKRIEALETTQNPA